MAADFRLAINVGIWIIAANNFRRKSNISVFLHMSLLVKLTLIALACFWLFVSCQKKKTSNPGLEQWLEDHFPGRFQIVATENDDAIRNLSFKVKRSIIAEKSAPEVQAQFKYDLRQPGLGLDPAEVEEAFVSARQYWNDASALSKAWQNAGNFPASVGARNGRISLVFYVEPSAAARHDCLDPLKKALQNWKPASSGYDLFVWLSEPGTPGAAILPLKDQLETIGAGRKDLVFSLLVQLDEPFQISKLEKEWIFNPDSERFSRYLEQSRQAAAEWLQAHPGKPCQWSDLSEYEQKN